MPKIGRIDIDMNHHFNVQVAKIFDCWKWQFGGNRVRSAVLLLVAFLPSQRIDDGNNDYECSKRLISNIG